MPADQSSRSRRTTRTPALAGLLLVAGLLLAACGDDSGGPTAASEDFPGSGSAEVTTASTDLGEVLVDGDGMTLYMFTKDTQSEQSACEAECLDLWSPLADEPEAGEGVDASLIGTIDRSDGSAQATYDGWPLYYFQADEAPGDVKGQGVNDAWYALTADGTVVKDSADAPSDSGGGGGYGGGY